MQTRIQQTKAELYTMAKKTEAEMCEQQLETERKKICCCDFIQLSLMFSYSTHFFP